MNGELPQYHDALDLLQQIDAPVKLVIAGNHDRTLDEHYVLSHRKQDGLSAEQAKAKVTRMRDFWLNESGRARKEGVTFLEEGIHEIMLVNGASVKVYASPYTPAFMDFGFPYERYEDRYNPRGLELGYAINIASTPVPSFTSTEGGGDRPLDILITHGPPHGRMDETSTGEHVGCPHLLRAVMRARPSVHCFGHIHEGWGAERVRWASEVDAVATATTTTNQWVDGGWEQGVARTKNGALAIQKQHLDLENAKRMHGVFVDISKESGDELKVGEESVSLNNFPLSNRELRRLTFGSCWSTPRSWMRSTSPQMPRLW